MLETTTVGLDLAKNVFQAHGADASGRAFLRKKLIPMALKIESRPLTSGGGDGGRIIGQEGPSVTALVNDIGVAIENGDGELVGAQVLPDVLNRVELGRVGRQRQQGDVVGHA